jgi:nucleotide-binding universal stress UspA family protein
MVDNEGEMPTMYKKILIATDGSEPSAHAVQHGVNLAKALGAEVLIVNVTEIWSALEVARAAESGISDPIEQYEKLADRAAEKTLADAAAVAKKAGVTSSTLHVRDQAAAEGVVTAAKDNGCDLIVTGTHGRRGVNRMILGSQAIKVLHHSEIPVLVVR